MLKKIYFPLIFMVLLLAGCQLNNTEPVLEKVNQVASTLTALRQSISISQTNETQNLKNSQLSMAVMDKNKGFEGKIIKKQDGDNSQITSVISNPATTIYKENGSAWQYSITPDVQTKKINIVTYHQTREILSIIETDADWLQLPSCYIVSFKGQNTRLNDVINRLVQEDYADGTIHNLQIVISKNSNYINKVIWQAKGTGYTQKQSLLSEIELNFANHNNLNVTDNFAQISEYNILNDEELLNNKEIN